VIAMRTARIEVWYSKEFDCWYVAEYDVRGNQIGGAVDFHKKSDAISFARYMLPKINISHRKDATI